MENIKLHNGDCLQMLDKIDDNSISLVITSPPYNIGIKYNKYKDEKPRQQYLLWLKDIFTKIKNKLTDDGHLFLNIGYTNKDPWIDMEVALLFKDIYILQNNITWVKSISVGKNCNDTHGHFKPINSKRYITPTNEKIFHFTKIGNVEIDRLSIGMPYKWKCNQIKRPSKTVKENINILCEKLNTTKKELPRNKLDAKSKFKKKWKKEYEEYFNVIEKYEKEKKKKKPDKRCKGNTWFIPYKTINSKKEKGYHPATFPEELVEHCLKLSNVKKGIVLDPFLGSGTTLRVVKQFNQNENYELQGIGIDIDEDYIAYCEEVLQ